MGADLYINKLRRPVEAEWRPKFDEAIELRNAAQDDIAKSSAQKLVDEAYEKLNGDEHYFRDSYNGTSVLWRLGMSWWRDLNMDTEYVEGNPATEINVSAKACREFRERVAAAELKPAAKAELVENNCKVEDEGENSVEGWNKYYAEKRDRLLAFLDRAIEHGGMYASC